MTGIIIQARSGSTRLPNKMILDFQNESSILDLVIIKVKNAFPTLPIILATTSNQKDDILSAKAQQLKIEVYRGSEENVLERFITAANYYGINKIIRVCADNPFLDIESLKELIHVSGSSDVDYISFQTKQKLPTIKTHYGFWAEAVKLSALEKVDKLTNDIFYREHVTNYVYGHPENFSLKFLAIPEYLNGKNIRLTIDTQSDFNTAKEIYKEVLKTGDFTLKQVCEIALSRKKWQSAMATQIQNQAK